jgi:phosphoribosylaminoimidazole-succinocarboxamide synthase
MFTPTPDRLLYEGKAKQVYSTERDDEIVIHYKDDATAFNGVKKASIADKGVINCRISAFFMEKMAAAGVPTAFVAQIGERDQRCHKVEIIPVEVVIRNVVAGGLAKRLGLAEGTKLAGPVIEHFYKSDSLNDPQISEDVALQLGYARGWELAAMREYSLVVNRELQAFWNGLGVELVDFKLEFGRYRGAVVLADEITPDGSRLWERATGRKLDKDVFRRDLADLGDTYRELYRRVFGRDLHA